MTRLSGEKGQRVPWLSRRRGQRILCLPGRESLRQGNGDVKTAGDKGRISVRYRLIDQPIVSIKTWAGKAVRHNVRIIGGAAVWQPLFPGSRLLQYTPWFIAVLLFLERNRERAFYSFLEMPDEYHEELLRKAAGGTAGERSNVLSVRDNGSGVRSCDLPYIFEKGFTGHSGEGRKEAAGMGLYLAREIARDLGLSMEAASGWGKGFEMRICFPVVRE